AHAVEVEVDRDTGRVRILDYVAAHDIGKAINPTMVEGQIIGGIAMGLGAALGEELIYEEGRLVNPAYLNYALPRAADLPRIRPILIEEGDPGGPYGAKSIGELSVIPAATAVGGGSDVLLQRRQNLIAPSRIVSLAEIEALAVLRTAADGAIEVGAGVTLARLARELAQSVPLVAEAVASIASPQVRAVATVGGNLVQAKRCWFFRTGFDCYKRGGATCPCYAVQGDHRFYHAAVGAHRCQATTPSDLATVLLALDADIVIGHQGGERVVPIASFYTGPGETVLGASELVLRVRVPKAAAARRAAFEKLGLWQGDFAVASAAVAA